MIVDSEDSGFANNKEPKDMQEGGVGESERLHREVEERHESRGVLRVGAEANRRSESFHTHPMT